MKPFNTFGFILIAGIMGCAMAEGNEPTGYRLAGYFTVSQRDIDEYDKAMCERNGGIGAYDALVESWYTWTTCLEGAACLANIGNDDVDEGNSSTIVDYEDEAFKYCASGPVVLLCFDNFVNSLENCIDPDKKESAQVIRNVTNSLAEFMCEDEATRLKNFLPFINDESSNICIQSKKESLQKCTNETISLYIRSKLSEGVSIGGFGINQWFIPDVEKCAVLENFQHCVIEALRGCTTSAILDPLDALFNHVKLASTCDHILKSQAKP